MTTTALLIVSALFRSRSFASRHLLRFRSRVRSHLSSPAFVVTTPKIRSMTLALMEWHSFTRTILRYRKGKRIKNKQLLFSIPIIYLSSRAVYFIYIYYIWYVIIYDIYIYVFFFFFHKENKNFTGKLESHQVSTIYNLWKEWYTEYKKSSFYEDNHLEKARQTTTQNNIYNGEGEVICACVQTEKVEYRDESMSAPVDVRRGTPGGPSRARTRGV